MSEFEVFFHKSECDCCGEVGPIGYMRYGNLGAMGCRDCYEHPMRGDCPKLTQKEEKKEEKKDG